MACSCPGKQNDKIANWAVHARECNYSAFNGYHRTMSAYSGVHCESCLGVWRTKAAYVNDLPDKTIW